ncbi:polysaccharide biosynthesis/export family protein [Synechococcus sp. NB0720_010]|uniref:polysaccharide biosynthesis/export family protein n=1 Tax=Synechococcus sp. NB0720_010 TaxID=2907159 RepID=UPI001FF944C8|nr:polysaccharide biosynthesis/export family protein [Synechococcus sp. NB0720_010]UPH89143.1 polysaccharide biosynthesis/export family protein [Synechococcus sp. NB0720_010]
MQVELLGIPDLSGTFSIGPGGTMYLPRLRALYVEGLTVEELRYFLTEQFKTYVKNPQVFLTPVGYRAVGSMWAARAHVPAITCCRAGRSSKTSSTFKNRPTPTPSELRTVP